MKAVLRMDTRPVAWGGQANDDWRCRVDFPYRPDWDGVTQIVAFVLEVSGNRLRRTSTCARKVSCDDSELSDLSASEPGMQGCCSAKGKGYFSRFMGTHLFWHTALWISTVSAAQPELVAAFQRCSEP